jgi:hypothetical protein
VFAPWAGIHRVHRHGIAREPRPQLGVRAAALLDVGAAHDALERVARALGDLLGRRVVDVDGQVGALDPALLERPAREPLERLPGDPAPAGVGGDDVAELGLGRLYVDLRRQRQAEERPVVAGDRERLLGARLAAPLVARVPLAGEVVRRRLRDPREAQRVRVPD